MNDKVRNFPTTEPSAVPEAFRNMVDESRRRASRAFKGKEWEAGNWGMSGRLEELCGFVETTDYSEDETGESKEHGEEVETELTKAPKGPLQKLASRFRTK